jgi:phosphate transport system permease protein
MNGNGLEISAALSADRRTRAEAIERRTMVREARWVSRAGRRRAFGGLFHTGAIAVTLATVAALGFLLWSVASEGFAGLTWDFLERFPSRFAAKAGVKAALYGSAWLTGLTAAFAIPVGVGAAIYLEEFARDSRLRRVIDVNIANLAGVPSIIYGMLGLAVFVRTFAFGRSLLAGALTMSILILPIIIVATREALKAVPSSLRQAAFGLGATRWQTIRAHVLPAATPGVMTGIILAMARATGETAPLILIGALNFIAFVPEGPMDSFTVLPIQIFNWASRPQEEFHAVAASGIIVLLAVVAATNALAVLVRQRAQRSVRW